MEGVGTRDVLEKWYQGVTIPPEAAPRMRCEEREGERQRKQQWRTEVSKSRQARGEQAVKVPKSRVLVNPFLAHRQPLLRRNLISTITLADRLTGVMLK